MGTPASALASSLSSAGSAASGAGSLISSISSLLPSTQTGKYSNSSKASSDTLSTQGEIGTTSSSGKETTTGNKNILAESSKSGSESNISKQTQTGTQSGVEAFSGAQNTTTTQTMLTDPAVMRIVNLMLQGDAGIPGLQQVVSGERGAGVFNSSTNQMLVNNLLTTIGGEVARMSAPTVSSENLGSSSTTKNATSNTTSENVANILSKLADLSTSKEGTTSTTDMQSQVLNALLGLATQSTDQSSESSGSSKTKSHGLGGLSAVGMIFFGLFGASLNHEEYKTLQSFASTNLSIKEKVEYYRFSARFAEYVSTLPLDQYVPTVESLYISYVNPISVAYNEGNIQEARSTYKQMITTV